MRNMLAGLLVCWAVCSHAERGLFDPSVQVPVDRFIAPSAELEYVQEAERTALRVHAERSERWPGVTFPAPKVGWDLSGFGRVAVTLRNSSSEALTINARVDNPGANGREHCLNGRVTLSPGQMGRLEVDLRSAPPEDWTARIFGMRGLPGGIRNGRGIELDRINQILLFLNAPKQPLSFDVLDIRVEGEPWPMPWEEISTASFFPVIDRYGQYRHAQWPGKTLRAADLLTAGKAEDQDLAAHPGPADRNTYGGWTSGPRQKATGFFYPLQVEGRWWLVDPEGSLFWSHGVDCVHSRGGGTPISDREHLFEGLPGTGEPENRFYGQGSWAPHGYYQDKGRYRTFNFTAANLFRKYGGTWETHYAGLAHQRLRSWGLNTVGNWSDRDLCLLRKTPYTVTLGTKARTIEGSTGYWRPFPDPYDPAMLENLRKRMKEERDRTAGDPWCLGYFVDNELSWGKEHDLALATLKSPADQFAKKAFMQTLREKYTTIQALEAVWGLSYGDWNAFLANTETPDVARAGEDLSAFAFHLAGRYFKVCRQAIKEIAPNQIYLGCRFSNFNDQAVRAAAVHCDVITFNRYRHTVDDLQLPEGVDRPILIGEFHFGALDRGMFHTGLVATRNQAERAEAYQTYVRSALVHPQVVGTHWFQYGSQATTGRGDGENYQIGFLDLCDTPYPELITASRAMGEQMYRLRMDGARP